MPSAAGLLSLRVATATQGFPHLAAIVFVRNGGGASATLLPCPCAVPGPHTLNPVAETMPDRCIPEFERVIAKMGSLLPYARARTLLSARRRTMRVGARLVRGLTEPVCA
jgi:hypothetical protein